MKLKVQGVEVKSRRALLSPNVVSGLHWRMELLESDLMPVTSVERIVVCQDPGVCFCFSAFLPSSLLSSFQ